MDEATNNLQSIGINVNSKEALSYESEHHVIDKTKENKFNLDVVTQKKTAMSKVLIARHQDRPHTNEYISHIFLDDFIEIHGDRQFGDDKAIIAGLGRVNGYRCVVIGNEKGRTLEEKKSANFGCAMPEGYRKAIRAMRLAHDLRIPLVTLVDTPGAYPGIESEERGQAHAIAECLSVMFDIDVPVLSIIHGEGGSGGAVALAAGNVVLMLENSVYSVISPEGCAEILWKDVGKKAEAAEVQKITAGDMYKYGIIDDIIAEPPGGAHEDVEFALNNVKRSIINFLEKYCNKDINHLQNRIDRYNRFSDEFYGDMTSR